MANEEVILTHEAGYASANYKSLEGTKNVTKRMGCFMAHVGDEGAEELKLEDVPIICNNNKKKAPAAHKSPVFDCDCFDYYTNYWFRWDTSVNRELIHQVIEAIEENFTSSEQVNCRGRKPNQKKEKASHRRFAGKALNPSPEVSVSPSYNISLVEECAKEEHEVVEESPETDATTRRGLPEVKGLFNWRL
ncbi:uncharacterized protein LOC110876713 [Helianthus annuus]|uniref:uncharacterized protein LOC110876713 n=1 Tax=Helianthus annuus TaxID=4232 RepID=UPI001652EDA2|nr:uncharacterized protein LOC110876713 [Helianthus annuus]